MPGVQLSKSVTAIPDRPEVYGDSLAHVLHREQDKLVPLGQAWIAGPGQLVTCGHVVEKYLSKPAEMIVKFPASGNAYEIRQVKIHPSFSRQDGLLKYDAALILIDPIAPESLAPTLPVIFDKIVKNQQTLYAVRYPLHLGSLSAAPNPLVQEGRLLGPLRREDNLHLLHDLPLSPGDSGTPLFDQTGVVAMHCGDTASLPGLNLPTTSIRMALSTDALRDLGVPGTTPADLQAAAGKKLFTLETIALFLVSACLSMALIMGGIYFWQDNGKYWRPDNSAISPFSINLSQSASEADVNQQLQVLPSSPCHIYIIFSGENQISLLYPPQSALEQKAAAEPISIALPKDLPVLENPGQGKLLVIAVKPDYRLLKNEDVIVRESTALPLVDNREQFFAHLDQLIAGGNAISQQFFSAPATASEKVRDSKSTPVPTAAADGKMPESTQTPTIEGRPPSTQPAATDVKVPASSTIPTPTTGPNAATNAGAAPDSKPVPATSTGQNAQPPPIQTQAAGNKPAPPAPAQSGPKTPSSNPPAPTQSKSPGNKPAAPSQSPVDAKAPALP
jgi:hypothetical protein